MFKIAIVGCGYWGPNLIRTFNALPECEVSYVCDLDHCRLSEITSLNGDICITNDIDKILNDSRVDIVAIATPVRDHYQVAKKALFAGKHLLIEKPVTSSSTECLDLMDLAEKKNLTILVGHTYIYSPHVRTIKQIISNGELGEIRHINARRLNLGLFRSDVNVAWDLAPHDISIILFVLGKTPYSVNCTGNGNLNCCIEDVTTMYLNFDDGMNAMIQSSWLDPNKVREITFVGTKRMLVYNDMEPNEKIKIYDKRVETSYNKNNLLNIEYTYHCGDTYSPGVTALEPLKVECQHLINCIKSGKKPDSGAFEGLMVVKVLEAASRSLQKEGAKINIDFPVQSDSDFSDEELLSFIELTNYSKIN